MGHRLESPVSREDGGGDQAGFRLDQGQVARISLAWWPTKVVNGITVLDMHADPKFIRAGRHPLKGVGYFINQGPEYTTLAGAPPEERIATIIVGWPMTSDGVLDKEAIKNGRFSVMPWVFEGRTYGVLKAVHEEWNLGQRDLKLKCIHSDFQEMTFSPCQESLLRNFMEKGEAAKVIIERIVSEVEALANSLPDQIGRMMTLDEIREALARSAVHPDS